MQVEKRKQTTIFEETLFDHIERTHKASYLLESAADHYNHFLSTGIPQHQEPDFIEFTYSYFDEKNPLLEFLLTRIMAQNLSDGKIDMLFDIAFIDNLGTFHKFKYLKSLICYLKSQNIEENSRLLAELERRITVLNNYSVSDYCLNMLQFKDRVKKGLCCKYLFIDSSNSFEMNDRKVRSKKEGTIGRRYSYGRQAKHADIQTQMIDIVNYLQVTMHMKVIDFKIDYFSPESLIYVDNGKVCVSRKLLSKIEYKTQMCHIVSFYLLNATYGKFIAEFLELRKMTVESMKNVFGAVKSTSSETVEFWLVVFKIEDFQLRILRMESLKNADIVV